MTSYAAPFRYWHPVLPSEALGVDPVGIELLGTEIAVFRAASGRVGALVDVCPHRRMRLSLGEVDGERLRCAYHGWRFERTGEGESHGKPRRSACAMHFDAIERHGAIWLKRPDVDARFPHLEVDGFVRAAVLNHTIEAPHMTVVDNFIEVEHTGMTHDLLGYHPDRMNEVEIEVEASDDAVRVTNVGPQKPLPRWLRMLFGLGTEDRFVDDWVTRFDPVHSVYDHYWLAPSGERRPHLLRTYVFFNPIDEQRTQVMSFVHSHSDHAAVAALTPLLKPLVRRLAEREIELDRVMIESLADKRPDLDGMKLGRFDRALGEARKRVATIYHGTSAG